MLQRQEKQHGLTKDAEVPQRTTWLPDTTAHPRGPAARDKETDGFLGGRNPVLSSAGCTSDHSTNHWATSRLYSSPPHRKLPAEGQMAALHGETCAHPSPPQPVRALTHQGQKAHSFGVRDLKQLWYGSWEKKYLPQNSHFSLH